MASSIFNAGGGAGIGSYVIVFKDGILDPKTDFARLRGAYDSGDSIYLSLIGEGYDEALIPASGWVDEDDKLRLVARDFDDGKTYTIDLGLNAHEAEVEIEDGIEIAGAKIPVGASVPEPQESDRGLYLKVSDQGELEYAEGGSGEGKITLDVETIARRPTLNKWYDLRLGEYTQSDFDEHKFILTYKGMIMEEVGVDYLKRMNVRPPVMPGEDGQTEATFAFMGGDRIFVIVFYRNGKGTVAPYGVLQPSAAYAVGDVNNVTYGYQDYDAEARAQVGRAVVLDSRPIQELMDNVGPDQGQIAVTVLGEDFAQTGVGLYQGAGPVFVESSTLAEKGSAKDVEGPITNRIEMRAIASGTVDDTEIHCDAHIKAQAKWQQGTKDADASDASSLELRAPTVNILAHQLTYACLDPVLGERVTEPTQVLFGKYGIIIPMEDDISTITFRNIPTPFDQNCYPELLILSDGVYLEVRATYIDAANRSMEGTVVNLKSGFSAPFDFQNGEFVVPSNRNALLKQYLLPYHSPVEDDMENYTTLDNTCVWPGNSHKFTSDITNLELEEFYIKHDFSRVRISKSGTDYDGTKEFTVVTKDIYIGADGGAYGGKFWFYTPDGLHWAEINLGDM